MSARTVETSHNKWHERRVAMGEVVRGGWFVFRRGGTTGRIKIDAAKLPFEHGTREAAMKEAARLANANPGVEFSVFHMQVSVRIDLPTEEEAVS